MRIANKKIGTDLNMNPEANNLIDTDNNSTSNKFNHAQVPILIKETTTRALLFTHPQPNKALSATIKTTQKNRSSVKAICEKFIGPCPSIFYHSPNNVQRKSHILENKSSRQHQASEKYLQDSANMHISHEYLNKIRVIKSIPAIY